MYDLNFALNFFLHSAKGSTWENHKYIKRINGTYYYPDSYEGGRHLPDSEKETSEESEEPLDIEELSEEDIDRLADEVIRGNFGNGQVRRELLGAHYDQIQARVNQKYMQLYGSTKISEVSSEDVKTAEKRLDKAVEAVKKSPDLEQAWSVYRKKEAKK